MNPPTRDEMETLLRDIQNLRTRTYRLLDYSEPSVPAPPAAEEQIRAVETAYRIQLPASYRLFLSIHNGWEHWSGAVALVSTNQMLAGPYAERIAQWRAKNGAAAPILATAFVAGFSLFTGEQVFFDYSTPNREVVVWDHSETERFTDFYEYLQNFRNILNEELASDLT